MNHLSGDRPIFIVGCERSGTTLLRVMLTSHSRIAIPYEAHRFSSMVAVPDPWSHRWTRQDAPLALGEFLGRPKPAQWGVTVDDAVRELGDGDSVSMADLIAAAYRAYASKEGKPRWGDKTPSNAFEIPHLVHAFPDAQFIHIVRDGRDVYLSWSNVDFGGFEVREAALKWAQWVGAAAGARQLLASEQYLEIRYETLIAAPAETLATVCAFLGERFEEAMLGYHAAGKTYVPDARQHTHHMLSAPPDSSRAGVWRRDMTPADIRAFEEMAGSTLRRFGYPVSLPGLVMARLRDARERLRHARAKLRGARG